MNVRLENCVVSGSQRHLRIGSVESRLQPPESGNPIILAIFQAVPPRRHLRFHRDRNEKVGELPDLNSGETRARDAYDRQRSAVYHNLLVENSRIASEMARPIAITQHCDSVRTRRSFIARAEHAPQRRLHSEHLKIISGYELGLRQLCRTLAGDTHRSWESRQQVGKGLVTVA